MKKVKFFRSIQLKFIIIYILLLLIAVQVIGSYVARELEAELLTNFKESTNDRIDLLTYNLEQAFERERTDSPDELTLEEEVQNLVTDVDQTGASNIQILNDQGRVLGTNDYLNQDTIGKKITDPIVQRSLKFKSSLDNTLLNQTTGERIFVRAEPILDSEDTILGVIYLEASLENVYGQLEEINKIFLRGSIIALIVSAILGVLVARAITKPIVEMRHQAQTMARGDYTTKVQVYGADEISQLAMTFNHLNDRLSHSRAETEQEQRKLSSVLENMSEAVIATDSHGEILLTNEAAGRLFKQNPYRLISRDLLTLLHLDEKITDMVSLQDTGSIVLDFSTEEEILFVRANFTAIYNDEKREDLNGVIAVLSDVTEDEKTEQERRAFVSNVSHELRTPLTSVNSYTEALLDGAWKDPTIAPQFLEVTKNETDRMIRMINDLLQLSRVDSEEMTLNRQAMDFNEFFHTIIDRFEMNTKDGNVRFYRYIPDKLFTVWMDKDRMTQVLDNILSNAVKYSPDGGKVVCKVERQLRHIVVSVKDEGLGIKYDQLDKIFERFYRVDQARTRELGGTGLGLSITRELVEAHYGRIWAESVEGKGTTIFFTLPLMSEQRRREI
ncbi:MAG TPA: cell wall metabolism sensor histidine kinase WalK [Pseudogracilibacillus sp.]|nr:cell wall metabolism sensor histidine kinase WalK [Pseudogracilibacillus sp.]